MKRRQFLAAVGATTLTAGSGCAGLGGGGEESLPEPVDLSGGKRDDQGGMEIGRHGGPNGQIFYESNAPEGHDNPAWFHTLAHGLFPYYFEHREMGWTATAVYATDYSTVGTEVVEVNGRTTLPSPTAPETFGNARESTYVMDSDVAGGMGPELIPFSEGDDARAFVSDHGGETVEFGDVTPELIASYTR